MLGLNVEIDDRELKELNRRFPGQLRRRLKDAVEDVLTEIELTQIERYLSDSMPAKPPGSEYVRTFRLRESSQRRVLRASVNTIEAEWFTDLSYAPFVIGSLRDQADIHQGRWLSLEEVGERVNRKAPDIVVDHLRKIREVK